MTNNNRSKIREAVIMVMGVAFDCQRKAARFRELKALEARGLIVNVRYQGKRWPLHSPNEETGARTLVAHAVPDFIYTQNGETIYEDAGRMSSLFRMKQRMVLAQHGIKIRKV
jgi:hypothetical protein